MIILSNKLYHLEIANDQFTTIISLGNKQFKIIQQNGTATISEMNIRDFPHINEAASHFGIAVENIVGLNKYEGLAVCRSLSCPSWALYVEIRALINGQEVLLSGTVLGKPLSPNR